MKTYIVKTNEEDYEVEADSYNINMGVVTLFKKSNEKDSHELICSFKDWNSFFVAEHVCCEDHDDKEQEKKVDDETLEINLRKSYVGFLRAMKDYDKLFNKE